MFKLIGYYAANPEKTNRIRYGDFTHINYSFAIPQEDGSLIKPPNPETAREIIKTAHSNNTKVFFALGGWSYNDVRLDKTFTSATDTAQKIERLANAAVELCMEFEYDGVDVDWEYPLITNGGADPQFDAFILKLKEKLYRYNKQLTLAVMCGVDGEGKPLEGAAAYSDLALNAVDWVNIMAYDGDDGAGHSPMLLAKNCIKYWRDVRRVPAHKLVLGVPFYGRPFPGATYDQLVGAKVDCISSDEVRFDGKPLWYNCMNTIAAKTKLALDNLGGAMVWELSADTLADETSLQKVMANTVKNR